MEQKKVNKEVENKRLEEVKLRYLMSDALEERLSITQKMQLMVGVKHLELSDSQDACMVKLRMNWKNAVTWIVIPLGVIILIAIGVVLSPLIVASVIFEAAKRVLGDKVVDCVSIPEIGEE